MNSASIAAAAGDLAAIPSTNDDNTSSTTSPPRIRSDQPPSSTTPRRRQRQQLATTGLVRPAKLSGRQSRRQKETETEVKGMLGNGADALLGDAEVDALEDESRCVGILFLAHDGVTNPSLWEKWRDSDPAFASRIRFFVFRNEAISHTSTFATDHDLHLRMRTKWCCSSIVHATIKSLGAILEKDADVGIIYVVSGFDIPIQPPSALFTTRAVVTEGVPKSVVPFRTVLAFTPGEDAPFKEAKGWGKKNEDVRESVACHVQWCGLARDHAQRIIEFSELDRFLDLGNKMSKACCPDEWVLGTILSLQLRGEKGRKSESRQGKEEEGEEEINPEEGDSYTSAATTAAAAAAATITAAAAASVPPGVIDWPVTDQYRAKRQAQSPLLWTDLDSTIHKVLWAPPQTYRTFTLEKVVEQVSRNEGNLFFRKVGPLTEKEIDRLIPLKKAKESPPPAPPAPPAASAAASAAAAAAAAISTAAAAAAVVVEAKAEVATMLGKGSSISSGVTDSEDVDEEAISRSSSTCCVPATPQITPSHQQQQQQEAPPPSRAVAAVPTYGHRVRDARRRRGCPEGGSGGGCCEDCS